MSDNALPSPPPDRSVSPPRLARWRGVFGSASRVVIGCIIVLAATAATLATTKLYVHARRHEIPIILTPAVSYERAEQPPLTDIIARMRDSVLTHLGWAQVQGPKAVALTFDDGPYAMLTPQLLDLLKRHDVKATFFIEGKDVQMNPELVRRMVDEGHELGNHSYTHASLIGLDETALTRELRDTDQLIRRLTGVATPLMRPPGGRLDATRYALVHRLGFTVVNDNDNPGDYRESDPLRLYQFILMHSSRGVIVCLHSGRLVTIRALPTIIDAYRRKGYRFVTVSELARLEGIAIPPLPDAR